MVDFLGRNVAIAGLKPSHFSRYKAELALRKNINTISNEITRARSVFIWLERAKKIPAQPDYGPDFRRASRRAIRKYRHQQDEDKTLDASTILAVISELGTHYRAMAMLGINCGFGPTDCMKLTKSAVDLERGWIEFPRTKTGVDRKCPLWDETIEALDLSQRWRPKPARGAGRLFFVRHDGAPFTESNSKYTRNFSRALRIVGCYTEGKSVYSMRHTLSTVAREVRDDEALKVILGHVDDSMLSEHYTHGFPDARLEAITDHVHAWLFASGGKAR